MVYTITPTPSKDSKPDCVKPHEKKLEISHNEHDTIVKSFYNCLVFGIFVLVYVGIGTWVFVLLEDEADKSRSRNIRETVQSARQKFSVQVLEITRNRSYQDSMHSAKAINVILQEYEQTLNNIVDGELGPYLNSFETYKGRWNYFHSLLFVFTLITTIGYGNLTPKTIPGRIFCVCFALIGIPITLIEIHLAGKLLATVFINLFKTVVKQTDTANTTKLDKLIGTTLSVLLVLVALFLYNTLGAILYNYTEGWGFINSFYFCFTTLTTVGFGDLIPQMGGNPFASIRVLYVLFGLALTSTLFELVRTQYTNSWSKMELTPKEKDQLFVAVQRLERQDAKNGTGYLQKTSFRVEHSTEILTLP